MRFVDRKIPGGKLLRVDFEKEGERITKIKISGDFFMYPNESIDAFENIISATPVHSLKEKLELYVKEHNVKIIGFSVSDLVDILDS